MIIIDDLITTRASEEEQVPVVAYPKSEKGLVDFEFLTARNLSRYTDAAVKCLIARGIEPVDDVNSEKVIAILSPSNLEFIITMLALSRLGYAVLILSPRLTAQASVNLLETVNCHLICFAQTLEPSLQKIQREKSLSQMTMVSREEFQMTNYTHSPMFELNIDKSKMRNKVAYIMHSSGSSGLPKPIYQTHQGCIGNYVLGHGFDTFLTVPLYHTHGHACFYRSIHKRCCTYFLNANVPVTSTNLINIVKSVKPAAINTVPYSLKLLAESESGIQAMKSCELVSFAGSAMADELGDRLVSNGIHVVSLWGSTETGAVMNSMRPFEDKEWSYMSIVPSARPHIWMKPLRESTFEMVALDGLESKVTSNSEHPKHSFHTKDMFTSHPIKKDRWKYLGRMDDRVTLSNGEKVLPLPMEGRLREEPLIREAVVFGTNYPVPGLLLFRSEHSATMSDETFLEHVMPAIDEANAGVESFAQVIRATVVPLSAEIQYPQTDKGTIIRAQVYEAFKKEIQDVYDRLDNMQEGTLVLEQGELESFVLRIFKEQCSIDLPDIYVDFFASGTDSLQAIKVARLLKQELYLGGNASRVDQSTIFEAANVARLAEYLFQLQSDTQSCNRDEHVELMYELTQKYSSFQEKEVHRDGDNVGRSAILTGATGSLGAHVLFRLLDDTNNYQKIYCLVRASSFAQARERVFTSMSSRGLEISSDIAADRLACLPSDLSKEDFGLELEVLREIRRHVSLIVHCAWSVNFNWALRSFENQDIKGTFNLLKLALSGNILQKPRFIFCSSISVAARASLSEKVPEKLIADLSLAGEMGYAQSKMVAEHIVDQAARRPEIDACVLRIGQIVGRLDSGVWNESELIPLIVRSSRILGCLPKLQESCSWLPVDCVAQAVIDVANAEDPTYNNTDMFSGARNSARFYNIVNPRRFSWTGDFLPALRQAGLDFHCVSTKAWLHSLQRSEKDPVQNPTIKVLPTLLRKYGDLEGEESQMMNASENEDDPVFETDAAQLVSTAIKEAPNVVGQDYVERFVKNWVQKWTAEI